MIEGVAQEIEHALMSQAVGVVAELESHRARRFGVDLENDFDVDLIRGRTEFAADIMNPEKRQFAARLQKRQFESPFDSRESAPP